MQRRQFLKIPGAVGLSLALPNCASCEFPQYSGSYKLLEAPYFSDPSFRGEKSLPGELTVTNRMEYFGYSWNHHLQFEFPPFPGEAASNIFTLELADMVRIYKPLPGNFPAKELRGTSIYQEPKVEGTSAFCNYQYLYYLFMETTPSPEILLSTYPARGECYGKDPVTTFDLCESLANPAEVEFDPSAWCDAVDENGGITLKLTLFRYRREVHPGWEGGYKDCILPYDPRKEASVNAIYHASVDNLCQADDIRSLGISKLQNTALPMDFFWNIISGKP